jgi:CRP-like cAMP-binding protein
MPGSASVFYSAQSVYCRMSEKIHKANSPLLSTIRSLVQIPPEEAIKFQATVREQRLEKGDLFVRAGEVPRRMAFVVTGLFRYFYSNQKGAEYTKGFFPENHFINSYTAMVQERPSHYAIEALEDSMILSFDYSDWRELVKGHSCWSLLLLAQLQKGFMKKESRERELLLFTAAQRYQSFLEEYPQLEGRIKQHLIASYLGITPVALSRIRSSKRLSPQIARTQRPKAVSRYAAEDETGN